MKNPYFKQSMLVFFFLACAGTLCADDAPFRLEVSYSYEMKKLQIDLQRMAEDAENYFMYRLEIYRNGELNMEEDLLNQNHLDVIERRLPFFAEAGDTLSVKIIYGDGDVFESTITVEEQGAAARPPAPGILVGSETDAPLEPQAPKSPQAKPEREFGYSVPKTEEYGYEQPDHREEGESYGYKLTDSATYSPPVQLEGNSAEAYGYEDEGRQDIGRESYGYSGFGYEGDPTPFGREDYEQKKER